MSQENIADASKPNAGRMYDYYLGGSHNFEVDRKAGDQALMLLPFIKKFVRLQRWGLKDLAVELSQKQGYDVIIDFASGLPTEDHIHYNVPEGTVVIYSDYDPITVEYAYDILGDTPNVFYFEADATQPEKLLNNPKIQQIIEGKKKVAYVLWGVTVFLPDEAIKHITSYIYEHSGQESCLAFNAQTVNPDNPNVKQVVDLYDKMGTKAFPRQVEAYNDLIKPWKTNNKGWIPLLEWHGLDKSELGQEQIEAFGPLGGGHGAFLVK